MGSLPDGQRLSKKSRKTATQAKPSPAGSWDDLVTISLLIYERKNSSGAADAGKTAADETGNGVFVRWKAPRGNPG
jgi:hypothetical protein